MHEGWIGQCSPYNIAVIPGVTVTASSTYAAGYGPNSALRPRTTVCDVAAGQTIEQCLQVLESLGGRINGSRNFRRAVPQ